MSRRAFSGAYVYSERVDRYYRVSDGRLVPPSEILKEVDRLVEYEKGIMRGLFDRLAKRQITLPEWKQAMRDEVIAHHTAMAGAAFGGFDQLDEEALDALQPLNEFHLRKLNAFSRTLGSKKSRINGRSYYRSTLYAQSGRTTFLQLRQYMLKRRGVLAESITTADESCDQCLDEERKSKGGVKVSKIRPIGKRTCKMYCKCYLRVVSGGASRQELREEGERIRVELGLAA